MSSFFNDADYAQIARLCTLDIGREVRADEIRSFFLIGGLGLGDPTVAFERFSTEEVLDLTATILKEGLIIIQSKQEADAEAGDG